MITFPEAALLQADLKLCPTGPLHILTAVPVSIIQRTIDLLEVVKRIDFYTTAQPPIEHPELPFAKHVAGMPGSADHSQ